MTTLKLQFNNDVRRISVDTNRLTYESLVDRASSIFSDLGKGRFHFIWVDDEFDNVQISSDIELEEAVAILRNQDKGYLKFQVCLSDSVGIQTSAVHQSVSCDECKMKPIIGIRYKCTVRPNFDLCSKCEMKKIQPFPLIKVYNESTIVPPRISRIIDGLRPAVKPQLPVQHPFPSVFPQMQSQMRSQDLSHNPFTRPKILKSSAVSKDLNDLYTASDAIANEFGTKPQINWRKLKEQEEKIYTDFLNECKEAKDAKDFTIETEKVDVILEKEDIAKEIPVIVTKQDIESEFDNTSISTEHSFDICETSYALLTTPSDNESTENHSVANIESVSAISGVSPLPVFDATHITYPAGSELVAGSQFIKTWKVCNRGNYPWPPGCRLEYSSGDFMCSDDFVFQTVPCIPSNESDEIALLLFAPMELGRKISIFKLIDNKNQVFCSLIVDITVIPASSIQIEYSKIQQDNIKWNSEIDVLQSMGFLEMDNVIPLLEEYVREPAGKGKVNMNGVTRVVEALLNF